MITIVINTLRIKKNLTKKKIDSHLFKVKIWYPKQTLFFQISLIIFTLKSMANCRTASSSFWRLSNFSCIHGGIRAWERLAIFSKDLTFVKGNIPGRIGTLIPICRQSFTNCTYKSDSKKNCVIIKFAPASTCKKKKIKISRYVDMILYIVNEMRTFSLRCKRSACLEVDRGCISGYPATQILNASPNRSRMNFTRSIACSKWPPYKSPSSINNQNY